MKSLSHTPEADRLRGVPLASWPQSLVTVSIEAQAKPDGPWTPSQKNKPIKADSPDADATVEAWKVEANGLVAAGKLHSWRIVLTAEPQVHSFCSISPQKPLTGTNSLGVKPPLPHTAETGDEE
jgi:hypothetical protein